MSYAGKVKVMLKEEREAIACGLVKALNEAGDLGTWEARRSANHVLHTVRREGYGLTFWISSLNSPDGRMSFRLNLPSHLTRGSGRFTMRDLFGYQAVENGTAPKLEGTTKIDADPKVWVRRVRALLPGWERAHAKALEALEEERKGWQACIDAATYLSEKLGAQAHSSSGSTTPQFGEDIRVWGQGHIVVRVTFGGVVYLDRTPSMTAEQAVRILAILAEGSEA